MSTILNNTWDIIYIQTLPAQEVYVNYLTSLLLRNGSNNKRLQYRCFPVNIRKTLKTLYFRRIPLDNYFCLFQSSTWKCARKSLLLIKLQVSACNLIKKETLALVLPCEFREISKNTFSYRRPPVAASVFIVLVVNKKTMFFQTIH